MQKKYEIKFKNSKHSNEVRTWVRFAESQLAAEGAAQAAIDNEFWGQGVLLSVEEIKSPKIKPPRYNVNVCYTLHHSPSTTNASEYVIYKTDYNGKKGPYGYPTEVISKPPSKKVGKEEMQNLYRSFEEMNVCAISPDKTMVIVQY